MFVELYGGLVVNTDKIKYVQLHEDTLSISIVFEDDTCKTITCDSYKELDDKWSEIVDTLTALEW